MKSTGEIHVEEAVEGIRRAIRHASPTPEQLVEAAEALKQLARSPAWQNSSFRLANPGEELVYELSVASAAASLYLVSDGIGTFSRPHCHRTWAIIVGIRGNESNSLYRVTDPKESLVAASENLVVAAGEALILPPESIHSTMVVGSEATFHLHLYGCPLHELSTFESRCYRLARAA